MRARDSVLGRNMGAVAQKCNLCLHRAHIGKKLVAILAHMLGRSEDKSTQETKMRALTFVITCFATPLLADCPTRADMTTGVMLREANGESETFTLGPNGFVRGIYEDGAGNGAHYLLLGGIYVVEVFDTENGAPIAGTRSTFAYPVTPSEVGPPTPGGRWDVTTLINEQGSIHQGDESHIYGPNTEIMIGKCGYDMIPIISIYHSLNGYEERLNYLPEFGFAYLYEMKDPGEPPLTYDYVAIEAAGQL